MPLELCVECEAWKATGQGCVTDGNESQEDIGKCGLGAVSFGCPVG